MVEGHTQSLTTPFAIGTYLSCNFFLKGSPFDRGGFLFAVSFNIIL